MLRAGIVSDCEALSYPASDRAILSRREACNHHIVTMDPS